MAYCVWHCYVNCSFIDYFSTQYCSCDYYIILMLHIIMAYCVWHCYITVALLLYSLHSIVAAITTLVDTHVTHYCGLLCEALLHYCSFIDYFSTQYCSCDYYITVYLCFTLYNQMYVALLLYCNFRLLQFSVL